MTDKNKDMFTYNDIIREQNAETQIDNGIGASSSTTTTTTNNNTQTDVDKIVYAKVIIPFDKHIVNSLGVNVKVKVTNGSLMKGTLLPNGNLSVKYHGTVMKSNFIIIDETQFKNASKLNYSPINVSASFIDDNILIKREYQPVEDRILLKHDVTNNLENKGNEKQMFGISQENKTKYIKIGVIFLGSLGIVALGYWYFTKKNKK